LHNIHVFWQCVAVYCSVLQCVAASYKCIMPKSPVIHTEWRRPKGYLKSQVIFRKRATNHRALLRKMTFKDKASYGSTPLCKALLWIYSARLQIETSPLSMDRALLRLSRPLLSIHRTLLRVSRALLSIYRTLVWVFSGLVCGIHEAFFWICRALFWIYRGFSWIYRALLRVYKAIVRTRMNLLSM